MLDWKKLEERIASQVWGKAPETLAQSLPGASRWLRLVYLVVRDVLDGQLSLRAMSLVYTSMLSLVPLLAVAFSVLKAFGAHNYVGPLLDSLLLPLGPKGVEVSSRIIGFVDNIKVGVLGSVGLASLIYLVISLMQKIESALNFIWRVRQPRSLSQRFSEYTSVLLVGPVLVFAALGITASVTSTALVQKILATEVIGTAAAFAAELVPYVLVGAAFTFIYVFIPNTRVRFVSALVGGVVAGILWQTVGWAFASFVATSAKYAAIYSGFAVLALFMIWLYVGWYILLVGAVVAYYHQYPQASPARIEGQLLSASITEQLALLVMFLIGHSHYHCRSPWTVEALAAALGISTESIQVVIDRLVAGGLLLQIVHEPPAYVPAQDIEQIGLKAVLDSVRSRQGALSEAKEALHLPPALSSLLQRIDQAVADTLRGQTVKTVVIEQRSIPSVKATDTTKTAPSRRPSG